MDYKISQSRIETLMTRNIFLVMTSSVLLISNLLLICLTLWALAHQARTVVPVTIAAPFTVTDRHVDASFLRQMSLFFIEERLNNTPDTVKKNHDVLLDYTDPVFYAAFSKVLQDEEGAIVSQKISSVFYPTEINVYPDQLTAVITGSLKRAVGDLALPTETKTYVMAFSYRSGVLRVKSFNEMSKEGVGHAQ